MNLDKIIDIVRRQKLNEMMTVGAGGIAGTVEAGDDPPVGKRKKKKKEKKKYISLGRGARKAWMV
jgi:hypothetical protein